MSELARWVEGASGPALLIDFEQRVRTANDAACHLLGIPTDSDNTAQPASTSDPRLSLACYELLAGSDEHGRNVCGPNCPAIERLRNGRPTAYPSLHCFPRRGATVQVGLTSLLLPPPSERYALLLLHPIPPLERPYSPFPIELITLGAWRLLHFGQPVARSSWKRPGCLDILKLLLIAPDYTLSRERIADVLWPESTADASRSRLKVLLSHLRQGIGIAFPTVDPMSAVQADGDLVRLNPDYIKSDVEMFETGLEKAARYTKSGNISAAIQTYQAALSLYGGDFLPEDIYSDWTEPKRTRLRTEAIYGFNQLGALVAAEGNLQKAIAIWRKGLELEPWREALHCRVMHALHELGYRVEAIKQFHICRDYVNDELGIEPGHQTTSLYHEIMRGQQPSSLFGPDPMFRLNPLERVLTAR